MMRHIKLDCLTYFLNGYWHQMGDEIYGTIEGAAAEFCSESDEYIRGLLDDLEKAEQIGLFALEYRDPVYNHIYWSQFQTIMNKADVDAVRRVLTDCPKLVSDR